MQSAAPSIGRAVSHPAGGVKDGSPVMVFRTPTSAGRPASAQHHRGEGALLMLLPRGWRVGNGWRMGDELCHQTRGLKDGRRECYQSCLDQDVRLSRSCLPFLSTPSWVGGIRATVPPPPPSSCSSLPSELLYSSFLSFNPPLLPFPSSSLCSVFSVVLPFPGLSSSSLPVPSPSFL